MPTLSGAYGRDYKSKKAVLEDWNAGKDFIIRDVFHSGGTYVNRSDATAAGWTDVNIRYSRDTKVCVLKRRKDGQWT